MIIQRFAIPLSKIKHTFPEKKTPPPGRRRNFLAKKVSPENTTGNKVGKGDFSDNIPLGKSGRKSGENTDLQGKKPISQLILWTQKPRGETLIKNATTSRKPPGKNRKKTGGK